MNPQDMSTWAVEGFENFLPSTTVFHKPSERSSSNLCPIIYMYIGFIVILSFFV